MADTLPPNPSDQSFNQPHPAGGTMPYAAGGAAPQKNTVGLVGFILSLIGLLTCCAFIFSIAGTIVSAVGLGKKPRGFAVAGLIIGIVGCILGALSLLLLIPAYQTFQGPLVGVMKVTEYASQNRALPDEAEFQRLISGTTLDGANFRYRKDSDRSATLLLPGFDGVFDTDDDISVPFDLDDLLDQVGAGRGAPADATGDPALDLPTDAEADPSTP